MSTFEDLRQELSQTSTTLVAVSKTQPIEAIRSLYDLGQRDFGENRIEEIERKKLLLPADIKWHLIGPVQSKKIKLFSPDIFLFHALDRLKIWRLLHEWSDESGFQPQVLLQLHVAQESTKTGFMPDELLDNLKNGMHKEYSNVKIRGVMAMATFTDDRSIVQGEFARTRELFEKIKADHFSHSDFNIISMGMSGDYRIAIDEGATMVRVGSLLFGPRK